MCTLLHLLIGASWIPVIAELQRKCPHAHVSVCRLRLNVQSYTFLDWLQLFLPCVKWLRTYRIKEYLLVRTASLAGAASNAFEAVGVVSCTQHSNAAVAAVACNPMQSLGCCSLPCNRLHCCA